MIRILIIAQHIESFSKWWKKKMLFFGFMQIIRPSVCIWDDLVEPNGSQTSLLEYEIQESGQAKTYWVSCHFLLENIRVGRQVGKLFYFVKTFYSF